MVSLKELLDQIQPNHPISLPPTWLQGRTAYGGLSSALAHHSVKQHSTSPNLPLKSAQISFIGPVSEDVIFTPEILRQGKSATQISVDAKVNQDVVYRANFVYSAPRDSNVTHDFIERPEVLEPAHYPSIPESPFTPQFLNNFEVKFVNNAYPMAGIDKPDIIAWVRLKDASQLDPETLLLAIGDCLPPATMACFTRPAPVSSLTWSVDFPQPAKANEWFLLRSTSLISQGGYSFQIMHAWYENGELALISTQTVSIFA